MGMDPATPLHQPGWYDPMTNSYWPVAPGSSYLVYRPARRSVVHQHHVNPLNELALIRSGLPPSFAIVDASTQTDLQLDALPDIDVVARLKLLPTGEAPPEPPPVCTDMPVGARLEMLWHLKGALDPAWYAGVVDEITTQANGKQRHWIRYDGWGERVWGHDLASESREWRRVEPVDAKAPDAKAPTTRA